MIQEASPEMPDRLSGMLILSTGPGGELDRCPNLSDCDIGGVCDTTCHFDGDLGHALKKDNNFDGDDIANEIN